MLHSQESEQAVLGVVLFDPDCLPDVLAAVSAEDFYLGQHREAMRVIEAMHNEGEPVDLVTVTSRMRSQAKYLGELAANVGSSANVLAYADTVRDYARRRGIIQACRAAIEQAQDQTAGEVTSELVGKIEAAGEKAIGASLSFSDVLRATADAIAEASENARDGVVGMPTGIPVLDRATSGLSPRRFYVVAARPSLGKTALVNQICLHGASRGFPVGVCSLEMGEEELGARALSNQFGINFTRLLRGDSAAAEAAFNGLQAREIQKWPIFTDTSTYSLVGIEARIASWVRHHGIRAAVVDHIGLVEVEGDVRLVERVGLVTRRLKKLAKRFNIAIVGVCQLNRGNEKEGRRPRLSDLRDSGNIEQDVDCAIFLHTDPENLGDREIEVEFGFLKNRTGRRGWTKSPVVFDGSTQTFRELSPEWEGSDVE